jgi:predicted aspartyl protease
MSSTRAIRKRSTSRRAAARIWSAANALAAAGLVACAQPLGLDDSLALLPFDVEPSGRIVIDVEINRQGPYRFAVDTAATGSFLTSRTQAALGLGPVPGITATVHGAVASGVFPVIDIDELRIGAETWQNARLIALPGDTAATTRLDGVLGADFLRRYAIGISTREKRMRLYSPPTIGARAYRDWSVVALERRFIGESAEPLHFLKITVAGRSVPALFDLGAGVSVLNPPAARALRLAAVRRDEEGEFSGAIGEQPVVVVLHRENLWTSGVAWPEETFVIADLAIFATLDSVDSPLAILGAGLFGRRDFIIDFARDRLLIRGR